MSDESATSGRLTSRLGAKRARSTDQRHGRLHLAAFLALREEIAEALEDGYTIKAVWEQLREEGAVQMVYETFRSYCKSTKVARRPLSAKRKGASNSGGMPPQTFKHNSVPDEKRLY